MKPRLYSAQTQIKSKETKLLNQLRSRIKATGPMTVAEYMKEVLINPMSVSLLKEPFPN